MASGSRRQRAAAPWPETSTSEACHVPVRSPRLCGPNCTPLLEEKIDTTSGSSLSKTVLPSECVLLFLEKQTNLNKFSKGTHDADACRVTPTMVPDHGGPFLCLITPLCSYLYGGLYGGLYERADIIRCTVDDGADATPACRRRGATPRPCRAPATAGGVPLVVDSARRFASRGS